MSHEKYMRLHIYNSCEHKIILRVKEKKNKKRIYQQRKIL